MTSSLAAVSVLVSVKTNQDCRHCQAYFFNSNFFWPTNILALE